MKNYNKILEAINRGIQFALDDFEPEEVELSKPKQEIITKEDSLYQNLKLREYVVDLGLPSGTLWCKYNLGCDYDLLNNHPEDTYDSKWFGKYYAWGELESNKDDFDWKNYIYSKYQSGRYNLIKYCSKTYDGNNGYTDNLIKLLPEDDATYQSLQLYGYKFNIPTEKQFEELLKYTICKDIDKYIINGKEIEGLKGKEFTSIKNGNKLFIPSAGYYNGDDFVDWHCTLWTSDLNIESPAYAQVFNYNNLGISKVHRCCGCVIRPVVNL